MKDIANIKTRYSNNILHHIVNGSTSLHNWVEEYNMECSSKNTFGLFGSLFFIGLLMGCIIFPRLGDFYGRKKVTLIGNFIEICAAIAVILSPSLYLTFSMIFF